MASTLTPYTLTSGLKLFRETDVDGSANTDIFGNTATTLRLVSIDNQANAAQENFVKFYNNAAPTVGTTAPDMTFPVAAGAVLRVAIMAGTAEGYTFATTCSVACVQANGGTGGTSSPTSDVVLAALASV